MKHICLYALLIVLSIQNTYGQQALVDDLESSFFEWNFGAAFIGSDFGFPGTSVLWGKTALHDNNFITEYEIGLAFPTIATAKIGVGKRFNNTNVLIGLRPYPFNVFLQTSLTNGDKGYLILSVEYNPLPNKDTVLSFESSGIINIGYRWNR